MKAAQLTKPKSRHLTTSSVKSSKKKALKAPIYLDNHATTPIDPVVLDTMLPYLRDNFGNPASTHFYGVKALHAVDKARRQVSAAIGSLEEEIFFTSGATESNNFVIKGVFEHFQTKHPHFIVSNIEHKCILEAAEHIKKLGAEVTLLKVNSKGLIEPEQLKKALRPNTVLVSVMYANNEIGSINPIRELAKLCHDQNILFHTDAAQAIGKVPLNVKDLGIDFLSASGHKFYGPKGIGFLYAKKSSQKFLRPLLDGGGQEGHLRSGTLNVPGIVGLGKAIELATTNMNTQLWEYITLRNRLYKQLRSAFPDLLLNGTDIISVSDVKTDREISTTLSSLKRLPHNLNITIPSVDVVALGNIYTVAFSSTSACSSGEVEPSYVLQAIGRTPEEAKVSLRFGIGRFNTQEEVDQAASLLIEALATDV